MLGAALGAIAAPGVAHADCVGGIETEIGRSVNFTVGTTFAPDSSLVYGIETRQCFGPVGFFFRIEAHRGELDYLKLLLGARAYPFLVSREDGEGLDGQRLAAPEVGVALHSDGTGYEPSLGVHVGLAYGVEQASLVMQGTIPILGDRSNYDVSLVGNLHVVTPLLPFYFAAASGGGGRPLTHGAGIALAGGARALVAGATRDEAVCAASWAHDARLEHSSIWSFIRLARELAAVSAPTALVQAALDAAEDEARHAELCMTAAGPMLLGALPASATAPRFATRSPMALAQLAREAFVEGCLGEGAAAGQAQLASLLATEPASRDRQAIIARDERRHAELAWAILAWALAEGGSPVRDALAEALAACDDAEPATSAPADTTIDHDWQLAHGRLDTRRAESVRLHEHELAHARATRALARGVCA